MSYKERARAYFSAVNDYDAATIERMVDESYIQHNPFIPTGRAAFLALLPRLKKCGSRIRNIRILEDGPYVIMHHRWENAGPLGYDDMVAFHVIRFDHRSLIAEHWNVMMKAPSSHASGSSCTDGPTGIEDLPRTETNRARVTKMLDILTEAPREQWTLLLPDFFIDRYSPLTLGAFGSAAPSYRKLHKIFGEGNFTLSVSEGVSCGVSSAIYDLFRLENGRIAGHWRIAQEIPTRNLANDNTMFGFR